MKKVIMLLVSVLLALNLLTACGSSCKHEWAEATCTAAQTCTKCGMTEGNPLGHSEGACTESYNIAERQKTVETSCATCGEIYDTSTIPADSFVKEDIFVFSPQEFLDYFLPLIEEEIGNFSYSVDDSDGKMFVTLNYHEKLYADLCFLDKDQNIIGDLNAHNVWGMNFMVYSANSLLGPYVMHTCDPALTLSEAVEIYSNLPPDDTFNGIGLLPLLQSEFNGIYYYQTIGLIAATASYSPDFLR